MLSKVAVEPPTLPNDLRGAPSDWRSVGFTGEQHRAAPSGANDGTPYRRERTIPLMEQHRRVTMVVAVLVLVVVGLLVGPGGYSIFS